MRNGGSSSFGAEHGGDYVGEKKERNGLDGKLGCDAVGLAHYHVHDEAPKKRQIDLGFLEGFLGGEGVASLGEDCIASTEWSGFEQFLPKIN